MSDHRFLDMCPGGASGGSDGVPRRYRDSGMAFDADGRIVLPNDVTADAFALADVDEAAARLARLIEEVGADAVVTYDPGGGYGHPDHVQAHRVTMRAAELVAGDGFTPRVFWVVLPESVARQRLGLLASAIDNPFAPTPEGPAPSMVVPDREVHVAIDGTIDGAVDGGRFIAAKAAALRAHRTQVEVAEPYFALSNGIGQVIGAVEYFCQVAGPGLEQGWAASGARGGDLFAE